MAHYTTHNFFCINCGNPTIPIMRKSGQMHGKFHRKRLYCYHCKQEINCIECRNEEEVWEFKEKFKAGEFKEEAKESLIHIQENTI